MDMPWQTWTLLTHRVFRLVTREQWSSTIIILHQAQPQYWTPLQYLWGVRSLGWPPSRPYPLSYLQAMGGA